jgi:hypothetical protein
MRLVGIDEDLSLLRGGRRGPECGEAKRGTQNNVSLIATSAGAFVMLGETGQVRGGDGRCNGGIRLAYLGYRLQPASPSRNQAMLIEV